MIASFQRYDGRYCRELVTSKLHQVVCREGNRWQTEVEVSRQDIPSDSYQPAGAGAVSVIDAYVGEHMAGLTIETAEERKLIDSNWQ